MSLCDRHYGPCSPLCSALNAMSRFFDWLRGQAPVRRVTAHRTADRAELAGFLRGRRETEDEVRRMEAASKEVRRFVDERGHVDVQCAVDRRDLERYMISTVFSPEVVGYGRFCGDTREMIAEAVARRVKGEILVSKFVEPPSRNRRESRR